jgi:hypothetical protein
MLVVSDVGFTSLLLRPSDANASNASASANANATLGNLLQACQFMVRLKSHVMSCTVPSAESDSVCFVRCRCLSQSSEGRGGVDSSATQRVRLSLSDLERGEGEEKAKGETRREEKRPARPRQNALSGFH